MTVIDIQITISPLDISIVWRGRNNEETLLQTTNLLHQYFSGWDRTKDNLSFPGY